MRERAFKMIDSTIINTPPLLFISLVYFFWSFTWVN
jgi:hypothetical protein